MFKKGLSLIVSAVMLITVFAGMSVFADKPQTDFQCNNVILLIGSGMSQDHIDAALIKSKKELNLSKFKYSGTISTDNSDGMLPDAAAAANALATGYKTNNFFVGNLNDGSDAYTITEAAKAAGKKVGIITDKTLCDPTPAAFSANATIKSDYRAITLSQLKSDVDLFLGGGSVFFDRYPKQVLDSGYKYIKSAGQLKNLNSNSGKVIGAFSNYSFTNGYNTPSLAEMLETSTRVLDNDSGFFIVCEAGRIEDASYKNNITDMTNRIVEFDEAIGTAMAYVDANPDTLLVVTGDYEAGSLTLPANANSFNVSNTCFKSKNITNERVPFFTYGKNASAFTGERTNTDIPRMLAVSMGIHDFINDIKTIPSSRDYFGDDLNSFKSWSFLNVKKNSKVNGVTLTTTSSNNSAVTATSNNGSLVIMANARVGFNLTIGAPLASPFTLKENGSNDLSAYTGFVISTSPLSDNVLTLTVGKGEEFSASIDINSGMVNEYGEILLEFSKFTPALTPETVIGLDTFSVSSTGSTTKNTYIIYGINAAKVDSGLNYAEVLCEAAAYDEHLYTADSYAEFNAAKEALKAAATRDEKYECKLALLEKIDALKKRDVVETNFDLIEKNIDDLGLYGTSYVVADKGINVFCGFTPSNITFTNIPKIDGKYSFISVSMSSLTPDLSFDDTFNVTLTVNTSEGSVSDTIVKPIVTEGKYCFDISNITSDITSIVLSFNNDKIGAIINVSEITLADYAQIPMKIAAPKKPSALEILRAAAGIIHLPEGDINNDGIVNVLDALQALRSQIGL